MLLVYPVANNYNIKVTHYTQCLGIIELFFGISCISVGIGIIKGDYLLSIVLLIGGWIVITGTVCIASERYASNKFLLRTNMAFHIIAIGLSVLGITFAFLQ